MKPNKDEEYIFKVSFHDGQIKVKEVKSKWKTVKRVLMPVISALLIVLIVLSSIYTYYRVGHTPFKNIIDVDSDDGNVEKITLEYYHNEDVAEYEIRKTTALFRKIKMLIWDIKTYFPRMTKESILYIPMGCYIRITLNVYMNNGDKHTVQLVYTIKRFGSEYAYFAINGKEYIVAKWRYDELYNVVEPIYNKLISQQ